MMKNFNKRYLLILSAVILLSSCGGERVRLLSKLQTSAAFEEVMIEARGNDWSEEFHPFIGATPIDIDGDGKMEIFVGGGFGNDDVLLAYRDGVLRDIIDGVGLSDTNATHGANSIDIDHDNDTDLLLARSDGVFIYVNEGGSFTRQRLAVNFPDNATPLNIAVGDIDGDGDGDLYISMFVDFAHFRSVTFNDPTHAKTNILLRNDSRDGNFVFTDITESSNTAGLQNTFLSSFIDLDNDGWLDLIAAQNTGQVEIFRNNGDGVFSAQPVDTGWGFWMGLAADDIDNDGDIDLFLTNSGNSVPAFILEFAGDGRDDQPRNYGWILLRNEGDFRFKNITADYELDDYGFAWGAVFEDLTLNGEPELLVAQNYIKWLPHHYKKLPNKSFVLDNEAFYHAPQLGLEHRAFSQSPLIVDMDNDGRPDVFWVDMTGVGRAFVNRSDNNFLSLRFADTAANIGAQAFIKTQNGASRARRLYNNLGMSTDHNSSLTFGLEQITAVQQVVIEWPDGRRQVIDNPPINQVIDIR